MDLEIGTLAVTPLEPKARAPRTAPAATDGSSALALDAPVLEGTIEPEKVATIDPDRRQEVFATPGGLRPVLDLIAQLARAHRPDLSTDAGRKATASVAYQVAKCKTRLDDTGKELVDELKALPKAIDINRKAMRDELDALRDEVRRPLTDWEADQARQQAFVAKIRQRTSLGEADATRIQLEIDALEALDLAAAPDFTKEARLAVAETLDAMCQLLKKRQQEEADAAELAQLREKEARRQREEAERQQAADVEDQKVRAAQEAQARSEREKEEADQRAADAEARAEQAKKDAQAQADAAAQAERDRQAATAKAEQEAADARAKDVEHRRSFNREALEDLLKVLGGDKATAKAVLTAIYQKHVRHIAITY